MENCCFSWCQSYHRCCTGLHAWLRWQTRKFLGTQRQMPKLRLDQGRNETGLTPNVDRNQTRDCGKLILQSEKKPPTQCCDSTCSLLSCKRSTRLTDFLRQKGGKPCPVSIPQSFSSNGRLQQWHFHGLNVNCVSHGSLMGKLILTRMRMLLDSLDILMTVFGIGQQWPTSSFDCYTS